MKQVAGTYAFRELTSEKELLHAFRLRYLTYQTTDHLKSLLTQNAAQVDVDGFDVFSKHYGLFKQSAIGEKMIGYLRVIERQKKEWVEEVVSKMEDKFEMRIAPRAAPFFYLDNFPNAAQLLGIPFTEDAHFISEVGRFVLLPEYRSVGLAQFIIESIMAVGFSNPLLEHAIIDCKPIHCNMYKRNGFSWIAAQENSPKPFQLMLLTRAAAEKNLPDMAERIQQYRSNGALHHRLGQVDWGAFRYLPLMIRQVSRRFSGNLKSRSQMIIKTNRRTTDISSTAFPTV